MSDSEGDEGNINLFQEPDDFYQPEKQPTTATHRTLKREEITLHLVGHNALWGHLLWNAGRTLAIYLEEHAPTLIHGKTVLELGAGAGLPSLICALHGAKQALVTDYPDQELVDNLSLNISSLRDRLPQPRNIEARGYLWGSSTAQLKDGLQGVEDGYDLLILADLLFNHSEHAKLIQTVQQTLKRNSDSQALVFFTPYRPWLLQKDLAFFDLAKEGGLVVEKIFERVMEKVMFEEDPGVR